MDPVVIVIALVVAAVIATLIIRGSQKAPAPNPFKKRTPAKSEYEQWLKTLHTVLTGGTKEQQDSFLKQEEDKIMKWAIIQDFWNKYNDLLTKYKK